MPRGRSRPRSEYLEQLSELNLSCQTAPRAPRVQTLRGEQTAPGTLVSVLFFFVFVGGKEEAQTPFCQSPRQACR